MMLSGSVHATLSNLVAESAWVHNSSALLLIVCRIALNMDTLLGTGTKLLLIVCRIAFNDDTLLGSGTELLRLRPLLPFYIPAVLPVWFSLRFLFLWTVGCSG